MSTNFISLLTSLLDHQDSRLDDVKRRLEATDQPILMHYYICVLSELQPSRDELAALLAAQTPDNS